jgi:hypothetical protein
MPRKIQAALALLMLGLMAAGAASAQCLPEVVVTGYYYFDIQVIVPLATDYPPPVAGGSGPGGAYSAHPSPHTNCVAGQLSNAQDLQKASTPSQPNNTALAIPLRYANPIDISNGSPIGASYGGSNGSAGFMVFPNLADGANAAVKSAENAANAGHTISWLIDTWAPPSINSNAFPNTLSDLGITAAMANSTYLSSLTATQLLQVVAAFSWQEGFKPAGC